MNPPLVDVLEPLGDDFSDGEDGAPGELSGRRSKLPGLVPGRFILTELELAVDMNWRRPVLVEN